MREIKFRGRTRTGEFVYGCYHFANDNSVHYICVREKILWDDYLERWSFHKGEVWEVDPATVGQYSGLKDKTGKEIYEGDVLKWCEIQTEYQTHEGDNIPLGSYTEPCGTLSRWVFREVRFTAPAFTTNHPEEDFGFCPIGLVCLNDFYYDIQSMTDIFFFGKRVSFEEIWEATLGVSEELKISPKDFDEFISIVSGFEVVGNVYQNPELL